MLRKPARGGLAAALLLGLIAPMTSGQEGHDVHKPIDPRAVPAVNRGVAYLKGRARIMEPGEAALAALAMIKADVKPNDPGVQACMARFLPRIAADGFHPERKGGHDNYEAAVVIMALGNVDPGSYAREIEIVTEYLLAKQLGSGGWDYDGRSTGDTSMTQYAMLGLWEAESLGVSVPPRAFDRAASWFLSKQYADGGWNYHPDEIAWQETVAMTSAGVGSLLICKQVLDRYRKGPDVAHPMLIPLVVEGAPESALTYKVQTTPAAMTVGARRGIEWIARNYSALSSERMGQSPFYGLYGVERAAALAGADTAKIPVFNWYEPGLSFVLGAQNGDGSWDMGQHGVGPNTCWAILFAVKSTEQSVRVIDLRRLGAGTQLGGRGLPPDLSQLTIANGRVVVQPMNGAIESMVAVFEDPSSQNIDSALAGLVNKYREGGPSVLKPFRDRFLKLLGDPDPGLRRVASWALGRTGDLSIAPDLIRTLLDPMDEVAIEARFGLQVLGRKVADYGPKRGARADQKLAAAMKWRDWYESIRPPELPTLEPTTLKPRFKAAEPEPASATTSAGSSKATATASNSEGKR